MAIDNLNFQSNGIPAGQQTDKYSSLPGCLQSKNVDIFSSSRSIKATAWSTPVVEDSSIVSSDSGYELRDDGKVYDENGDLVVDPATDFVSYPISYDGEDGEYSPAEFGTPQSLTVSKGEDGLNGLVVFTDRASYNYSNIPYIVEKKERKNHLYYAGVSDTNGYHFKKTPGYYGRSMYLYIDVGDTPITKPWKLKIRATVWISSQVWTTSLTMSNVPTKFYYDKESDEVVPTAENTINLMPTGGNIFSAEGIEVDVPAIPGAHTITLTITDSTVGPDQFEYGGDIYVDCNGMEITDATGDYDTHTDNSAEKRHLISGSTGDYNYYYNYLAIRDRELIPVGEYYWMKGTTFQRLYKWNPFWVEYRGDDVLRYEFYGFMGWENDPRMEIITIISINEDVYMIGNMNGNGYIIPCDLTGGTGTPIIEYGCLFKGATSIDYLMYFVGTERGISRLWAFNGQQLATILGGSEEEGLIDLIDNSEQYNFDGNIINYRKNLILSTTDNRIFRYGATFGGKGGSFIHKLPDGATINKIVVDDKDLKISYSLNSVDYITSYQDDTAIKNYNTEFEVVYPFVLGNHLIEKEVYDLYCSYRLPSSSSKLEFWLSVNHNYFWSFLTDGTITPEVGDKFKMNGCGGNYWLTFVEKNGNWLTFTLSGDLPYQINNTKQLISEDTNTTINYTEFNNFKKIKEIESEGFTEGYYRETNISNKLGLPRTYSLQLMVRGIGTVNYTPEIFGLSLDSNQRNRG